ncbi:type 1 glutamine amidotransferase [Vampirovibrio sp.]|uniref:type 1 glutamine amidotransferase n=1 Tax=Vampirovibrio sp. TaxID=2717857 RepID=UPI003593DB51
MKLRIAYLYPDQLNIYGDRGNILTLYQRCQWRGIEVEILTPGLGDTIDPEGPDLYFMGGGQDSQQIQVCEDIHQRKAHSLKLAGEHGAVFLTICGGYQLLGNYYKPHNGDELKGLSLIDAYTVAGNTRYIGNVAIERPNGQQVVGFENHSGRTYLGKGVTPLGKVLHGKGNNGEDGFEGVAQGNFYGTYLHGSLLPKNPALADELIGKALQRRYGTVQLEPLNDQIEIQAHQRALALKH